MRFILFFLLSVLMAPVWATQNTLDDFLKPTQHTFLPVNEAFVFDFDQQGSTLFVGWDIADDYYLYKDKIENYWKDKPVRFAYMNNCVGCWWRSPLLLKKMSDKCPSKMNYFSELEVMSGSKFRSDVTYKEIINYKWSELFITRWTARIQIHEKR